MGAGRKTSTYTYDTASAGRNFAAQQRNLGENLAGVIFGCTNKTKDECLNKRLFGLPSQHWCYVENIPKWMPLFLFNYDTRELIGIFRAESDGAWELDYHAWTGGETQHTRFPAQVQVEWEARCPPLPERQWKDILADNFTFPNPRHFAFELSIEQVRALCTKFRAASARENGGGGVRSGGSIGSAASGTGASAAKTGAQPTAAQGRGRVGSQASSISSAASGAIPVPGASGPTPVPSAGRSASSTVITTPRAAGPAAAAVVPRAGAVTAADKAQETAWQQKQQQGQQAVSSAGTGAAHGGEGEWETAGAKKGSKAGGGSWAAHVSQGGGANGSANDGASGNISTVQSASRVSPPGPAAPPQAAAAAAAGGTAAGGEEQGAAAGRGNPSGLVATPQAAARAAGAAAGQHDGSGAAAAPHANGVHGAPPAVAADAAPAPVPAAAAAAAAAATLGGMSLPPVHIPHQLPDGSFQQVLHFNPPALLQQMLTQPGADAAAGAGGHGPPLGPGAAEAVVGAMHQLWQHVAMLTHENLSLRYDLHVMTQQQQQAAQQAAAAVAAAHAAQAAAAAAASAAPQQRQQQQQQHQASPAMYQPGRASVPPAYRPPVGATTSPTLTPAAAAPAPPALAAAAATDNGGQPAGQRQVGQAPGQQQQQHDTIQDLYIMGGNCQVGSDMTWVASYQSWCPLQNKWKDRGEMPVVRGYGGAASIGRSLFVVGGGAGSSWLSSMHVYHVDKDEWGEGPSMSQVRGSLGVVAVGGKLYACGGGVAKQGADGSQGTYYSEIEVYDPEADSWSSGPAMASKRFAVSVAQLGDGCIYALGGYDGQMYLRTAERLDPREGKWQPVADMPRKRGSHSSACVGGQLMAVGGWEASAPLADVDMYDPRADVWRTLAPQSQPRSYGAAAVVDGALYSLGGMQDQHGAFNSVVERYVPSTESWQPMEVPSGFTKKRSFMAVAVFDRML